jgi:tRNA(Leu) C34 or U34 (ribose-2'-O)-methylase TrmL
MSDRGFATIGLYNPKFNSNIGGVLRACGCYNVGAILIEGDRYKKSRQDTQKVHRHIPVCHVDSLIKSKPLGSQIVAVEFIKNSRNLKDFIHPESAFYLFGPEDDSISKEVLDKADYVVYIPTEFCLNLSQAASTILYDRHVKTH